jgi:dephospho-CoA kinase
VPAIGITGGVGTGKSSFLHALLQQLPAESFDADRCVHELLAGDKSVGERVKQTFGAQVAAADGSLNRQALRDIVFADDAARHTLEEIIHPAVRQKWEPSAKAARDNPRTLLYLDIPLLYETGTEAFCDRVVVIACSGEVQRNRLRLNRGLAPELIERMIGAQLDLAAKVSRAEHVVWNDGSPSALDEQACLFAAHLRDLYG